jgi:hypothetical protein
MRSSNQNFFIFVSEWLHSTLIEIQSRTAFLDEKGITTSRFLLSLYLVITEVLKCKEHLRRKISNDFNLIWIPDANCRFPIFFSHCLLSAANIVAQLTVLFSSILMGLLGS